MNYVSAIAAAIDDLEDADGLEASVVASAVALLLCGRQLHAGPDDDDGRAWDVLGVAAQSVVEEFDDLPPMFYTVDVAPDGADAWRQTMRLVKAIADHLDRMSADRSSDLTLAWRFGTAAARLRAASPAPS